jgi:hypothetical protein
MRLDTTELFLGLGLAACALALIGRPLSWRKARAWVDPNASLLDAIIARQSPPSERRRATTRALERREPDACKSMAGGPELSVLEGHLRNAVLNAPARERLVADAMWTTGGNRAAAIRKVLRDLHDEDKRWS